MKWILTFNEAQKILKAKEGPLTLSLDLGLSTATIEKSKTNVKIGDQTIPLKAFTKVKETFCYAVEDHQLKKVALFSEDTNLYYKLLPTSDWPTITLSSTPMHRHTHFSPAQDAKLKIKEIAPIKGKVLDTCCGLGYTAILAVKYADDVYTFEVDKNVLLVASYNPYSQELWANKKIHLTEGKDSTEAILDFSDSFFDRIIHDPPTFVRAPQLYHLDFYKQLFRVLKKGGLLYHYAPAPGKTKDARGREFHKQIIKGLKDAGFMGVEYHQESSGVVGRKP